MKVIISPAQFRLEGSSTNGSNGDISTVLSEMNKRLLTLSTKEDLRAWDKSIRKDINGNSAQIRDLEVKVNRQADLLPTLVREEVVKTVRELQIAPHQSDQQRESFMVCCRCIRL